MMDGAMYALFYLNLCWDGPQCKPTTKTNNTVYVLRQVSVNTHPFFCMRVRYIVHSVYDTCTLFSGQSLCKTSVFSLTWQMLILGDV